MPPTHPTPRTQTGAVLLVAMVVLVLGALTVVVHLVDPQAYRQASERRTAAALAEAKAALIAYSVTHYYETHPGEFGFLPCPDYGPVTTPGDKPVEGDPHINCGTTYAAKLGRLPWKALSVVPTKDGSGECLWYAVSGHYKTGSTKAEMTNEDSNGQFEVYGTDGTKLVGEAPGQRAVAVVISPGLASGDQDRRSLPVGVDICGGNYDAGNYLDCLDLDIGGLCDGDTANAIDNAALSEDADIIKRFVTSRQARDAVNDRFAVITREELFEAIKKRRDFADTLYEDGRSPSSLTESVARCIAEYARSHPESQSLPFAAPVALTETDYRRADAYDDRDGLLSGRVPDGVDDSSGVNRNPREHVLSTCPPWNEVDGAGKPTPLATRYRKLWQHWKDHLFYAVARAYKPAAALGMAPACDKNCLRVNEQGEYAAVVIYAGPRLGAQVRDAPPTDPDTKNDIANYLEDRNASNHPNASGDGNYQSIGATGPVNDVLYCIEAETLNVTRC